MASKLGFLTMMKKHFDSSGMYTYVYLTQNLAVKDPYHHTPSALFQFVIYIYIYMLLEIGAWPNIRVASSLSYIYAPELQILWVKIHFHECQKTLFANTSSDIFMPEASSTSLTILKLFIWLLSSLVYPST